MAKKVKKLDVKTGKIEELNIPAKDSPMIQEQVKPIMDESPVFRVFYFVDEIVKHLNSKIRDER